jgi:hypothetical protein
MNRRSDKQKRKKQMKNIKIENITWTKQLNDTNNETLDWKFLFLTVVKYLCR